MPVIKPIIAIATVPVATGGTITTTVTPAVTRYFALIAEGMIEQTRLPCRQRVLSMMPKRP